MMMGETPNKYTQIIKTNKTIWMSKLLYIETFVHDLIEYKLLKTYLIKM